MVDLLSNSMHNRYPNGIRRLMVKINTFSKSKVTTYFNIEHEADIILKGINIR